jgi:high affinity cGMP-specific 3',5'-cyclic phosphodiesterase 9
VDVLSFLLAGICHDLGHDGYTNGYHINAMTDRAIRYSDVSVQENFHAAETFFIMQRHNFLDRLSPDQFKTLRKRVIGCILATDMAKHAADLSQLKSIVEAK